jgi:hypothetical protein
MFSGNQKKDSVLAFMRQSASCATRSFRQSACGPRHPGTAILRLMRRYATVRQRMNETFPVSIVSSFLMRVIKGHARWRWRA